MWSTFIAKLKQDFSKDIASNSETEISDMSGLLANILVTFVCSQLKLCIFNTLLSCFESLYPFVNCYTNIKIIFLNSSKIISYKTTTKTDRIPFP